MSSFAPTKVPKMHECRKERKRRTYRKSNQRAHYTHTTKMPRSFAQPRLHTASFSCAEMPSFPPTQQSTPKFLNALKSKVSDYLKRPSKFRDVYPSPQTDTLQILNLKNHLSRSQKVTKRHPEFLYTHEVREFLTIPHP